MSQSIIDSEGSVVVGWKRWQSLSIMYPSSLLTMMQAVYAAGMMDMH